MEQTSKVGYEALNNANVRISNANDAGRQYDISANFTVQGGEVTNVDSGSVTKDGVQKASFSVYGGYNSNVNFYAGIDEQCDILSGINAFVEEAKALVAQSPVAASL